MHVGPDIEAQSLQLGRGRGCCFALYLFSYNLTRREPARPWLWLPLLPLAVLFLCRFGPSLSCLFMVVAPMLTLIWAWALCRVPLWDGRSEAAGLS